jgi:hypothetical protein
VTIPNFPVLGGLFFFILIDFWPEGRIMAYNIGVEFQQLFYISEKV